MPGRHILLGMNCVATGPSCVFRCAVSAAHFFVLAFPKRKELLKMKRTLLSAIIVLTVILTCVLFIPNEASAASESDLTFSASGSNYIVYSCNKSATGELVIPSTYNGRPVVTIAGYAFEGCTGLSVTAIQHSAFAGCSSLKSITIPFVGHAARKQSEGYQYPFGYIFGTSDFANGVATQQYYCDYSPNIHTNNTYYIPASLQSVTVIGGNILYGAFYNCRNLTSVILPANITTIGSNAFYNCSSLTAINIPSTVTTIDSYAFSGCGSLNQVFLPVTVNNINTGAFDNCSNLWHVLYGGSQNQWNQISVANKNTYLTQAITHHGCTGKEDLDFSTKYCSVCSANCSHNWGSGTIIKHATCKEAGSKRYTCAICKATKTEVISKTSDHTYSAWKTQNDTFHSRLCSICHSEEQATHVWDDGTITKHPSCKETGSKNHLCTVCGKSKTVILEKLADHTYDNMCDPECNVCGIMRTISHQYKTEWIMTINDHWQECSICSHKQNLGAHIPGSAATESDPQLCTVCGYIIAPVLGHTHSFATSWIADKDGHWHACAGCNEKDSYSNHIWENGKCSTCGLNDPNAITPSVPNTSPNTVPSTTSPLPTDSNTSISTTPNSPNAFSQSAGPVWWWIVLSVCGFCLIIGAIVIILVRKKRPS